MKRFSSGLGLAIALSLTLAACGGGGGNDDDERDLTGSNNQGEPVAQSNGFIDAVLAILQTTADDTEPVPIDGIAVSSPNDTAPVPL